MASEHVHRIFHSGATEDPIVPVCGECGKDLMVLYMEQEQQLAQAREEVSMLIEQMAAATQDIAQAQEENERLQRRDAEWTESQAKAVTRYAQARALLERWDAHILEARFFYPPAVWTLESETRAFLA